MSRSSDRNPTWPKLPLKVRLMLTAHSLSTAAFTRSDQTLNRPLLDIFDPKAPPSSKPINGVVSSDITVDATRNLWFRLYTPTHIADDVALPVVVYFHGGGFCLMAANSKSFDTLCRRIACEIPAVVVSVNYRRAPEYKYPCQYEDGFDVLKFIDDPSFKGFPASANLKHCFLSGDSAGGNLAHHVAVKASEHQFSTLKLVGLIGIMPFVGGEEKTESEMRLVAAPVISAERSAWMWKTFLPEGSNRDHPAVNVFGPNAVDISGLEFPPTLVIIGGFDPLQDWQRRYVEGLKRSGKQVSVEEYPNAFHGFYAFPDLPETSLFLAAAKKFVQDQLPPK